jgi:hypothetical protein
MVDDASTIDPGIQALGFLRSLVRQPDQGATGGGIRPRLRLFLRSLVRQPDKGLMCARASDVEIFGWIPKPPRLT